MKDESIPFIGDIFLLDQGIFNGSCVSGNLTVSDLNIQDNLFEVELNLKSAIDKEKLNQSGVHVVIGIDIEIATPDNTMLPGSLIANMLSGRPEMVNLDLGACIHEGKLKIIRYRLIPIELINVIENDLSSRHADFDPSSLENIDVFQDYNKCWLELNEVLEDRDNLMLMPQNDKKKLTNFRQEISGFKENFGIDCFTLLQDLSKKNWFVKVHVLMNTIEKCRTELETAKREVANFKITIKGKKDFNETLKTRGITFVANGRMLNNLISADSAFVLFFCKEYVANNPKFFRDTLDFFFQYIEKSQENGRLEEFLAVDLDVIPRKEIRTNVPNKIAILHFSNGQPKSLDFKADLEKRRTNNTARCLKNGDEIEPKRRGKFTMPCPNSFRGDCDREYHEWLCEKCETYLDYGFNDCLYCNCSEGKGSRVDNFEFRCKDFKHGFDFVRYDRRCDNYLEKIIPMENISIIILGQSGVGKSTWINGMVNYMQYEDINIAKKSEIIVAVPTTFTITDQNYHTRTIQVGADDNEDTSNVGASGTQECKTYSLRYGDYNVQLIDTPGLGDTRGIEQDRKNVKKILDYIRYYDELHGICILLRPNESKIGVLIKFCIKEILTHLHKSCANNIVYCFTNSRSTFYRPGDTLPVLEKLLHEIQVYMPLNKNTLYCFDNESFRYLCTFKAKGIKYTADEERDFGQSWNRSVEETKRLLDYIIKLQPHRTQETMTLNQSRRMILSLTRPIADITHNIEMNIQIVSDHKKLIENMDEKDKNLVKNLYVPQVVLENVPLGHPRTVCTADRCVEYHFLPDSNQRLTEYVQHCHPHCYLKGVIPEQYPNPHLKHCAAMRGSVGGEWCYACKCSWKTHMHILYEQKRTEIRVKNQSVEANIGSKKDLRKEKERAIDDLEDQINRLKDEKKKIIKIAGKFAYFLKKHAITPYNDCFCDYLDYLIDNEQGKRYQTDKERAILDNLKKTKKAYQEEIDFIETAMAHSPDAGEYDPQDVKRWEEELYQLPIHGKQLRQNMKVVLDAEDNAARYNQKNLTATKNYASGGGFVNSMVNTIKNWAPWGNKNKNNHQYDNISNSSNDSYGNNHNHNSNSKKWNNDWHKVEGKNRGRGRGNGGKNRGKKNNF